MVQAKPGDTIKVKTILYAPEASDAEHYGPSYFSSHSMFTPKDAQPMELMCSSNVSKDLNNLLGAEFDSMKER